AYGTEITCRVVVGAIREFEVGPRPLVDVRAGQRAATCAPLGGPDPSPDFGSFEPASEGVDGFGEGRADDDSPIQALCSAAQHVPHVTFADNNVAVGRGTGQVHHVAEVVEPPSGLRVQVPFVHHLPVNPDA